MVQPPMKMPTKKFQCSTCGNIMEVPQGVPKPPTCSKCGAPAAMIHRIDKGQPGRGAGRRGAGGSRGGRGPPWARQT